MASDVLPVPVVNSPDAVTAPEPAETVSAPRDAVTAPFIVTPSRANNSTSPAVAVTDPTVSD